MFAIETGGHYWRNVAYFLDEQGIPFRFINQFTLKRRREGISIVMLEVENIEEAVEHFKSRGIRPVSRPLWHPKDTHSVMFELMDRPRTEMWTKDLPPM